MKPKRSELNRERRRATGHSLQLCLLPLLTVVVWAGCEPDAKVAADTSPVNTYALVSIDGNKLPYAVKQEGAAPTFKSGTFTISSDGTCSNKLIFAFPSVGNCSPEAKAIYTRQGSKFTMLWEGAGSTTGTVEGDMFTMNDMGMVQNGA